jgi:hypothetical protein
MPLDPDMYTARKARRNRQRQKQRLAVENVFNNQNAIAGPSHIPLPPSSNPQTLSQILSQSTSTHHFPRVQGDGGEFRKHVKCTLPDQTIQVPIAPPRWAVETVAGVNRNDFPPYAAVRASPRGVRTRATGLAPRPETFPLEILSNRVLQESPRLQSRLSSGIHATIYLIKTRSHGTSIWAVDS